MKTKNNLFLLLLLLIIGSKSLAQQNELYIDKFTGINPVSYTDVIFFGNKDTVLVSTYSGRISKIVKGKKEETVITNLKDEIYALAYNKQKKEILAATLTSGIIVIDEESRKIIRKLSLGSSWTNSLVLSENLKYLIAYDQNSKLHLFDIKNNYLRLESDSLKQLGKIINIDKNNIVTSISHENVKQWHFYDKKIIKESNVELKKFGDMDKEGKFLFIDFNECIKYDTKEENILYKISHPNWPLSNPENEKEIFEIPIQMQLNAAKFAQNYIYTAGLDRSVRVWNKSTGELIDTLLGHKGSISKLKVANDQSQVVSVDLKGGIQFWDVD